ATSLAMRRPRAHSIQVTGVVSSPSANRGPPICAITPASWPGRHSTRRARAKVATAEAQPKPGAVAARQILVVYCAPQRGFAPLADDRFADNSADMGIGS